jgi:hypothetical protein
LLTNNSGKVLSWGKFTNVVGGPVYQLPGLYINFPAGVNVTSITAIQQSQSLLEPDALLLTAQSTASWNCGGCLKQISSLTSSGNDLLVAIAKNTTSGGTLALAWGTNSRSQLGTGGASTLASPTVIDPPYNQTKYSHSSISITHGLFLVDGTTCYSVFAYDPHVCSNHGTCVALDTCVCETGYVGPDCNIPTCFGKNASNPTVCGGHGQCLTIDVCVCYKGYTGTTCTNEAVGILYGSGDDSYGQLFDNNNYVGSGTNTLVQMFPVIGFSVIGTLFKMVAAGDGFSIALASSGSLYSIGRNNLGQCADNTITDRATPYIIQPQTKFVDICVGNSHAAAIDENGLLYTWGSNSNGQLGISVSLPYKSTPLNVTQVIGNFKSVQVYCGQAHTIVLIANGTIFGMGAYQGVGIDIGLNVNVETPTQIYLSSLLYKRRVAQVAAGHCSSYAVVSTTAGTTDGILYSWGCVSYLHHINDL